MGEEELKEQCGRCGEYYAEEYVVIDTNKDGDVIGITCEWCNEEEDY